MDAPDYRRFFTRMNHSSTSSHEPGTDTDSESEKARFDREGWKGAKQLFGYLSRFRGYFIAALVAMAISGGLILLFPYLMGELFGVALQGSGAAERVDVERVLARRNEVVVVLIGVLLLQAIVAFFRITWFARAGEGALAELRREVYGRLVRLPMRFFSERRVGELSSRLAADLSLIRDTLVNTTPQVLRQLITLIGSLVMIFITSMKLSLFMLACLPVVILAMAVVGRRIRGLSREAQDQMADSNVIVQESLQGIADVKAFGNEGAEIRRYDEAVTRYFGTAMKTARARAGFVSFIILVMFGVVALIVWYGSGLLALPPEDGGIEASRFFRFILYTVFLSGALGSLPEAISEIQKAIGATQRVREILGEKPEATGGASAGVPGSRLSGRVALESVSFAYPGRPDVPVLREVSFECGPGDRVAIVGPSGAGKSTLISLLMRFYEPDRGSILLDGRDARSIPLDELRSQMAIVPQEVLLFGGTIRENIGYGRMDATSGEVEEAAKKANAHAFISAFPEGYDTAVGDRGVKLSGGQRQRIAIARAILADPSVLILDEATSALDSESEHQVQEALEELMKGRTSFIIAHRLATVRKADAIVVLDKGRIAEIGTHDTLVTRPDGLYAMLARLQFAHELD